MAASTRPNRCVHREDKKDANAYSNPYTYHASVLATILAAAINDAHSVATDTASIDAADADIRRIRIYNEQILYIARLCEALIKQLLYCTQIPKKYYAKASLGTLLSTSVVAARAVIPGSEQFSLLKYSAFLIRSSTNFLVF